MKIHLLIFFFLFSISKEIEPYEEISFRDLQDTTNGTTIDPITDFPPNTEIVTNNINKELESKPKKATLIGIQGKPTENNQKKKKVELTIFFKNLDKESAKNIFLKFIYFNAILDKNKRRLEESTENNKEILLCGELIEASLKRDIVEYNISKDIKEFDNGIDEFESMDIKPQFKFLDTDYFSGGSEDERKENLNTIKGSLKAMNNDVIIKSNVVLNDVTQQIFENSTLFFNASDKIVMGYLSYKILGNFPPNVNINIDKEKLIFNYTHLNEIKTFEGTFEKIPRGKYNYSISFRLKEAVETDLNEDCTANITQLNIQKARILQEGQIYKEITLKEGVNNVLYIEQPTPQTGNYGRKIASSSGLSGGAIAGIVIICVVVLISVALAFIYFNRPIIGPTDANKLEFYNNTNMSNYGNSEVKII